VSATAAPLAGQVALVTGASSGIGAAAARALAAAGAQVTLLARRRDLLEALAAELGEGVALPLVADVRDSAQVGDAVAATLERFGRLDAVVNSAGISIPASLADTDDEIWSAQIEANLSGSFFVARATAPHLGEGGSIVNVGSELSQIGMEMFVAYCASKAGVIGLTRALAAELAPRVRVNAVCPGPVDTPMLAAEFELHDAEAALAETLERVPMHRLAAADEVAAAILYLTADAPYATGTVLALDGGVTAV
jgi:NAD(P)-dependent dehydrogenase (short-subunit alcohol dehydrogenase family)